MSPRLLRLALLVTTLTATAGAQGAGPLFRMGMGARSLAIPSQVADRSGLASPYLNPALAPFQPSQGVELSAGLLAFDREWESVQVAAPLRPRSGFAAGVIHGGVSNIDGRDASGRPTDGTNEDGTYNADEYAFFAAFGTQLSGRVSAGVGLRLYRNDLFPGVRAPTAIGIALGASAQVTDNVSVGVVVDDLFARYEWNATGAVAAGATDYFPTRLRAGVAATAGERSDGRPRVTLAAEGELFIQRADATRPDGITVFTTEPVEDSETTDFTLADVQGRAGAEVWLVDGFAVRAGLDRIGAGAVREIRPSAGFGLEQRFVELDVKLDYVVVVEPFGEALMHLATVRLGL
ncbi:MAG: hypothetical protein AAGK21_14750 [Bacteroidota bacterium]